MKREIIYLYSKESLDFIKKIQKIDTDKNIKYIEFSFKNIFPSLDYKNIEHIVVTGSILEIKRVIDIASKHSISVGIVALDSQKQITKTFNLPTNNKEALYLALTPSTKDIDLLYCNSHLVLNDIRVGDASILKEYEFHYSKYTLLKRVKLFISALKKRDLFKHQKFTIATKSSEPITISAIGMIALGHCNHSWISSIIRNWLSASDGKNIIFILSPTSILQYFLTSPIKIFLNKFGEPKLPPSCGYIKSSFITIKTNKPIKVVIDDSKTIQTPINIETIPKALKLSVGDDFWDKQIAIKGDKNNKKLDNIPKDDEQIEYLQKGLPLFSHASKEQYSSLFSTLRSEGKINRTFVILLLLATIIATLGLFVNSGSVIIGAMILAPLMQPIVSLSMGMLRQDKSLISHGIKTIIIGILLTLFIALIMAYMIPLKELTSQMSARLSPTILDMLIAMASGMAAAYAKNDKDITASLAGVAIAVALVPPLAVSGIGIGWGDWSIFSSAFLLFSTNLIGIVLTASITFLALGYAPLYIAKKGIILWTIASLLITIPLYHSFEIMQERAKIKKALVNQSFDINDKTINLKHIEYQANSKIAEVRCEVIINKKLTEEERDILHQYISLTVGRPTEVIATFRYRL